MENSAVTLYTKDNWEKLKWEHFQEGQLMKSYFLPLLKNNTNNLIKNVHTSLGFVAIDDILLPYTVNEEEYDNSYVCSPYNHYITYSKEELSMLNNKLLEAIFHFLLGLISKFAKKIEINKVVYINNWLISTNLSPSLSKEQLESIKNTMLANYPDYLIGFRSINEGLYPKMKVDLEALQFQLLPSRFVYISRPEEILNATKKVRNTLNRDKKLLDKNEFDIIQHDDFTKEDLIRAKQLYDKLYLEKYSYNNPQFTEDFILSTHAGRALTYVGLKKDGVLEGVFGSKIFQNMMANPVLGYNTDLPKEKGLYRILRYLAVQESINNQRLYHQSAGVGRFKYDRGAKGYPEFTAIYIEHLAKRKQYFWKSLCYLLNRFAIKIVDKKKL
ncbi:GNAT family N-acetyltransferase [Virgibacillus sp. 6R]|uniref:GNAT family N-acetyltransferase n=1 Tax=Metabacillus sp. 22489 TaxID=3453928 RepID=UPI0011AA4B5D